VNPGSEPERDDTGLPPVDIEVPDDARELDRDVQAYYRELRASRRLSRSSRLRRVLARDGIALPILACCLIFALITGTLLTVFTASGINQGIPGAPGAGRPGASNPLGSAGAPAGAVPSYPAVYPGPTLPAAKITVDGRAEPLQGLRSTAFLLVPPGCQCSAALAKLAALMTTVGVPTLLVAPGAPAGELLEAQRAGATQVTDPSGALRGRYPHAGLTAVLVSADGSVQYADGLVLEDNMDSLLQAAGGLPAGEQQVPARR
jgi:hypothetical protein